MSNLWLIRTSENKIFGPVGSQKILELISRGSLKKNDEISSGNGFWIFVKEAPLIEAYLKQNKTQPFNPITEAAYVDISSYEMEFIEQSAGAKFPEEKDLEYPSMPVGSIMAKNKKGGADPDEIGADENTSLPSDADLQYPDNDNQEDVKNIVFEKEPKSVSEKSKPQGPKEQSADSTSVFPDGDDLEYPE